MLWSISTKTVIMAELAVPWEEGMDVALRERKSTQSIKHVGGCSPVQEKSVTEGTKEYPSSGS